MSSNKKIFPNWEELSSRQQVKSMPWYNENLDMDLENVLAKRKMNRGKFLNLGTGPGTSNQTI